MQVSSPDWSPPGAAVDHFGPKARLAVLNPARAPFSMHDGCHSNWPKGTAPRQESPMGATESGCLRLATLIAKKDRGQE